LEAAIAMIAVGRQPVGRQSIPGIDVGRSHRTMQFRRHPTAVDMATDLRVDNITPDKEGRITIDLHATGMNDAIIQKIEIE